MGNNILNSNFLTAIATLLLVLVGFVQIFILFSQKKQTRVSLAEQYRQLWKSLTKNWGHVIFIGREVGEYYQVLDQVSINKLREYTEMYQSGSPTIWALESIQKICGTISEICTRVLQGHLKIEDIYPIFGTEFLRQSRPFRQLLEPEYEDSFQTNSNNDQHNLIRMEIQDWLVYHDGTRRRCLILIDLLWAEAVRLEDLPPYDMKSAADSKRKTGKLNRKRIYKETIKLNGVSKVFFALRLARFLRKSEYSSLTNWTGINSRKLFKLKTEWTQRLLRNRFK